MIAAGRQDHTSCCNVNSEATPYRTLTALRWQKNKDILWYTRQKGADEAQQRADELAAIKAREEDLMAEVCFGSCRMLSFHTITWIPEQCAAGCQACFHVPVGRCVYVMIYLGAMCTASRRKVWSHSVLLTLKHSADRRWV